MKDPHSRWHLERARAALMIEASLSSWQRLSLSPEHHYAEWFHRYEWMKERCGKQSCAQCGAAPGSGAPGVPNCGPSALPLRPYFASTENSLAADRETAGRRKAGSLRGFMSAATRAFIDEK